MFSPLISQETIYFSKRTTLLASTQKNSYAFIRINVIIDFVSYGQNV